MASDRFSRQRFAARSRGLFARLARDARANTLALMAVALVPLSALAGSAVDMGRLYVVKVRLQQSCDAGVLAGRKFMNDSSSTTLDSNAAARATEFFNNNFRSGWMQTSAIEFIPSKTSTNRVAGIARATVPMSVMKMFRAPDVRLEVECEARFDIADTDIMFVLDTTGSMACLPSDDETTCSNYAGSATKITYQRPANSATNTTAGYAGATGYAVTEKSGSRISALRTAVLDFWDTMDAAKQPTTRVRYGFVPYTSTVNAGAAIMARSATYMLGGTGNPTWNYQTRRVTDDYVISENASYTNANKTEANCPSTVISRSLPALTYASNGQASRVYQRWVSRDLRCGQFNQTIGPVWTYNRFPQSVSSYVLNASMADPTSVNGGRTAWLGCIEELNTTAGATSFNIDNLPDDLNPDIIPTSDTNRWRPMWPDVEYQRTTIQYYFGYAYRVNTTNQITTNGDDDATAPWMNSETRQKAGNVSCGKPVQRLAELNRDQVRNYVTASDFVPLGGTYHDVGMIWADRLLSRNGIFAADNQAQGGRGLPKRVIVFLTDGDMAPSAGLYGLYGMETWDQRVSGGSGTLKTYHNARFLAACEKARAMKIDIWTVALGTDSTDELKSCASSPDQALATTSGSGLSDAFRKIAKAVAALRISR